MPSSVQSNSRSVALTIPSKKELPILALDMREPIQEGLSCTAGKLLGGGTLLRRSRDTRLSVDLRRCLH